MEVDVDFNALDGEAVRQPHRLAVGQHQPPLPLGGDERLLEREFLPLAWISDSSAVLAW